MMEAYAKSRGAPTGAVGGTDDDVAATALAFVNHLLDRDFRSARALLHPTGDLSEDALRDGFEPLFEGEAFPTSAQVFDIQADMPNLGEDGIAWVYLTIDSEQAEAVSLVVARHEGGMRVRDVEFGRP